MYQIEIKRHLVEYWFPPREEWDVVVDIGQISGVFTRRHDDESKASPY